MRRGVGRAPELPAGAGLTLWQQLDAAAAAQAQTGVGPFLHVSPPQGPPGCRCTRLPDGWGTAVSETTSLSLLVRAVRSGLSEHQTAP